MANETSLSTRIQANPLTRYGTAFVGTAGALIIARALSASLGECSLYIAAFPAVALSAWYCGLGPSAAATILGLFGLKYWFFSPRYTLAMLTSRQVLAMTMFLAAVALIVAMGETRRRELHALHKGQEELEERVRQRTVELDAANQDLRELTARLMQSQDDERRRIARELHDSVGQSLAALTMNRCVPSVAVSTKLSDARPLLSTQDAMPGPLIPSTQRNSDTNRWPRT